MSPDALQLADLVYESVLGLTGVWLLWALVLRPAARARTKSRPDLLPAWPPPASDFILFLLMVIGGGLVLTFAGGLILRHYDLSTDSKIIIGASTFQLGMLLGVGLFFRLHPPTAPTSAPSAGRTWLAAAATFVISVPLLQLTSLLWLNLLDAGGYPVERQPLVDLMDQPDQPWPRLVLAIFSIVIVAPVTEELIFRAGIFRFLRTRLPRRGALILSALLFAALHADVPSFAPLFVLGLVFALAYERTGRISTTMGAHALFNLNTLILILTGVDK